MKTGNPVPINEAFEVNRAFYDIRRASDGEYVDYKMLVASLGVDIYQWLVSGDYYQGDILVLVATEDAYGFVTIGYGSCCACDPLESCSTLNDLEALRDSISGSIIWSESRDELADKIMQLDPANHYWMHDGQCLEARDLIVKSLLAAQPLQKVEV
jgi:hypothetical protein